MPPTPLTELVETTSVSEFLTSTSEPCGPGSNCTTHGAAGGTQADDAIWILTSTFIIFTMQSGFGLLESGSVSTKNEVNIMVKNAADVIFGGLTYWMFGYGFSFGEEKPYTNAFTGWGNFFAMTTDAEMGHVYSKFFFQASFATTATTIVSGAMAERTKLESYILFSFVNTLVYCFPAHWEWAETGWLRKLGMVDIAGAGAVHLVGGITGLVATVMLKPRHGRYENARPPSMGSPTNAILGTFMLWWGWLGFNCGSTFGISGPKWMLAARSAISTLASSMAGGTMGFLLSYVFKKRTFQIDYLINGLLGSLVGITGFCALAEPWESFIIGLIGGAIALSAVEFINYLKIDDPVGCVGVHAVGGCWSLIAPGLFAKKDLLAVALDIDPDTQGLFYGGGFYLLGVQLLGIVTIASWGATTAFILLKAIDLTVGLRIPLEEELLGADIVEHGVGDVAYDKSTKRLIPLDNGLGFYLDSDMHVQVGDEEAVPPGTGSSDLRVGRRKSLIYESGTSHAFGSKVSKRKSVVNMMRRSMSVVNREGAVDIDEIRSTQLDSGPAAPGDISDRRVRPDQVAVRKHSMSGSRRNSKRSTGSIFNNLFRRRRNVDTSDARGSAICWGENVNGHCENTASESTSDQGEGRSGSEKVSPSMVDGQGQRNGDVTKVGHVAERKRVHVNATFVEDDIIDSESLKSSRL